MTYREACARLYCLPGTSQKKALEVADMRIARVMSDWDNAKEVLTKAEDELVEAKEIKRAIEKGEER